MEMYRAEAGEQTEVDGLCDCISHVSFGNDTKTIAHIQAKQRFALLCSSHCSTPIGTRLSDRWKHPPIHQRLLKLGKQDMAEQPPAALLKRKSFLPRASGVSNVSVPYTQWCFSSNGREEMKLHQVQCTVRRNRHIPSQHAQPWRICCLCISIWGGWDFLGSKEKKRCEEFNPICWKATQNLLQPEKDILNRKIGENENKEGSSGESFFLVIGNVHSERTTGNKNDHQEWRTQGKELRSQHPE